MKRAGEVVPLTISSLGLTKKYNEQSITMHWREIAGEEIYAHSRAVSLNRGVLLVAVDNSVWCHHLSISKNDIIHKLNSYAGEKLIIDIRFKAGNLKDYQNYENDTAESKFEQKVRFAKLSEQEKDEAEQKTSSIKNQTLRRKITQIIKKDIALRKVRLDEQWKKCQNCSVLCPPEEILCPACSLQAKKERIQKMRTILLEVPWLTFADMQSFVECSKGEYIVCKQDLQESFASEVRKDQNATMHLMSYIMLKQGLKPDQITDDIVEYSLHSLRRKKYVFTPGS